MSNHYSMQYATNLLVQNKQYTIFDIKKAARNLGFDLGKLPYSLRVLFENAIRHEGKYETLNAFKRWTEEKKSEAELSFMPTRVLMQDFTGVPAVVDLAAMRDAMKKIGGDPLKINPLIPVDLVIDHSIQVDHYGDESAFAKNVAIEMERNKERYEFLKWGQQAFDNFRVVPPGTGICHQVNLEYLAKVVWSCEQDGLMLAYPDSLVGTDSHTTMVNGLSVLGWGVGGIEAEAAMLGQPLPMILPEVVGFKLSGELTGIATATDLVLTVTQMLRKKNVVGKFVEFFGDGLASLSLADRATIANMAPEYGATCGFFPVDDETIKYMKLSGRDQDQIALTENYAKYQELWNNTLQEPEYTDIIELDLTSVRTSLAGPKRPQDRVALEDVAQNFKTELPSLAKGDQDISKEYATVNKNFTLSHGSVVIAAITSCTNTSNPSVMIAAGLVAKKACELGLVTKPWVKTSLAPGSKVVTEYYKASSLNKYLSQLGFNLVGYGCTTCIGNSGPLDPDIEKCVLDNQLVVSSVLSGNRNFEGRVHPFVRSNYLASPPLVVAYALAGHMNIDLANEPIAQTPDGNDVYLKDLWPTSEEVQSYVDKFVTSDLFRAKYAEVFEGDEHWKNLTVSASSTYNWDKKSTYINNPPYFDNILDNTSNLSDIKSAKILAVFGDSITTDHISPAGNIGKTSPAAAYLTANNIAPADFNSYGSRRGNHEVMMRGTFANNRIKNELCQGVEGGFTINQLTKSQMSIYDAAMDYKSHHVPLVIFAGKEYGTGSSRDWAAKGTSLLGVKAVIAESFERIHRSNLIGMGVLPITFTQGTTRNNLKLDGSEEVSIYGIDENIKPHQHLTCEIKRVDGKVETIPVILQLFTDNEVDYIKNGSIMHLVVRNLR